MQPLHWRMMPLWTFSRLSVVPKLNTNILMSLPKPWNKQTSAWKNHLLLFLTPTLKSVKIRFFFWALNTTYTFCKPQPPNFLSSMAPGPNHHKFGGSRTSEDRWNLWIVAGWGGEGSSQSDNLLFFFVWGGHLFGANIYPRTLDFSHQPTHCYFRRSPTCPKALNLPCTNHKFGEEELNVAYFFVAGEFNILPVSRDIYFMLVDSHGYHQKTNEWDKMSL